jgi:hypothetical protein
MGKREVGIIERRYEWPRFGGKVLQMILIAIRQRCN